jgi:hypothetical protein
MDIRWLHPKRVFQDISDGFASIGTEQLCDKCSLVVEFVWRRHSQTNTTISLGTYDEVMRRELCPLCRLVLHLVHEVKIYLQPSQQLGTGCVVRIKGDVVEVIDDYGPQGYILPSWKGKNLPADAQPGLDTLGPAFGHQLNVGMVRGWLQECEQLHVSCGMMDEAASRKEELDLILIDVRKECLVHATSKFKYVALSYVWGATRMLQTTKSNIDELRLGGAFAARDKELTEVVRDAMRLVTFLNERYLWVDSLCIVQDDAANKHDQIRQMNIIYGQAFLTLINMSGTDASSGLPGVSFRSRRPVFEEILINDARLISRPLRIDSLLPSSVYERRAWTYQERLLARRCLILSNHQAYFQCHRGLRSDISDPDQNPTSTAEILLYPLAALSSRKPNAAGVNTAAWDLRALLVYDELVKSYSRRQLSYPEDALNAFAGIESALAEALRARFVNGLPAEILDIALLWAATSDSRVSEATSLTSHHRNSHFPSWAWAGHSGAVSFAEGPLSSIFQQSIGTRENSSSNSVDALPVSYPSVDMKVRSRVACFTYWKKTPEEISDRQDGPLLYLSSDIESTDSNSAMGVERFPEEEVLEFRAQTTQLDRIFPVQHEWENAKTLLYDSEGCCCGRVWPDGTADWENMKTEACEWVLLSDVAVSDIGAHLQLGSHLTKREYLNSGGRLANLLLVEWKDACAERLGVGQVVLRAWEDVVTGFKRVYLA